MNNITQYRFWLAGILAWAFIATCAGRPAPTPRSHSIDHPIRLDNPDGRCFLNSTWQSLMASLHAIEDLLPRNEAELETRLDGVESTEAKDTVRLLFKEIQNYRKNAANDPNRKQIHHLSSEINTWYHKEHEVYCVDRLCILINLLCNAPGAEQILHVAADGTFVSSPDQQSTQKHQIIIVWYSDNSLYYLPEKRPIVHQKIYKEYEGKTLTYKLSGVVNHDHLVQYPRIAHALRSMIMKTPAWIRPVIRFLRGSSHSDGYVQYNNRFFYVNDSIVTEPKGVHLDNLFHNNENDQNLTQDALNELLPGEPSYAFYTLDETAKSSKKIKDHTKDTTSKALILPAGHLPYQLLLYGIMGASLLTTISCARNICDDLIRFKNQSWESGKQALFFSVLDTTVFCTNLIFLKTLQAYFSFTYSRILTPQKKHPLSQVTAGYPLKPFLFFKKIVHAIDKLISMPKRRSNAIVRKTPSSHFTTF